MHAATGTSVDLETYQVRWTTIKIEGTGETTYAVAILAKPELHTTLVPLFMAVAEKIAHKHPRGNILHIQSGSSRGTLHRDYG